MVPSAVLGNPLKNWAIRPLNREKDQVWAARFDRYHETQAKSGRLAPRTPVRPEIAGRPQTEVGRNPKPKPVATSAVRPQA
jgi:hypothetical protein